MHKGHSSISVAPLQIRKDASARQYTGQYEASYNMSETSEPPQSPRPRFQNYLRACYPFQPSTAPSQSTVTLPLNAGDIILIHTVHTNGWADGTLLETGERGWLPTNYCEAYDYIAMRPLLRSLRDFWDIMRTGSDSNLAVFQNKDYMRGLVAGVRYLLEKTNCLTRDATNVRNHDGIRRTRKGLLSDLSLLVKAGKQLQVLIPSQASETELDRLLDELLLRAFKIVTRAVGFFDVWGETVSSLPHLPTLESIEVELCPADRDMQIHEPTPTSTRHTSSTARYSSFSTVANFSPHVSAPTASEHFLRSAHPLPRFPIERRRMSLPHRMSYTTMPSRSSSINLASERLNHCYDAFLGVLASFLGSHMQSRCSSELLLTTQQAVKSCRQLLAVVEGVIERNQSVADLLTEPKDSMYDAITELVLAAKQVYQPLHIGEEHVYLPDEGRRLVQTATTCVSRAGKCVARTRTVLEDQGDFELDDLPSEPSSDSDNATPGRMSYLEASSVPGFYVTGITSEPIHQSLADSIPSPPVSEVPSQAEQPLPTLSYREDPPCSLSSLIPPLPMDRHLTYSPGSDTTLHPPVVERLSSDDHAMAVGHLRHKSVARSIIQSTGSDSTMDSSRIMTDASTLSTASTRATSMHASSLKFASQESLVASPLSSPEEDPEAVIAERTFAHELIFNRDGLVIGGSLNALVERLTAHDSTPDPLFFSTVYLTFRLFARPQEFVNALVYRFRYAGESHRMSSAVSLRVYNAFKGWLESHWRHDCDDVALPSIVAFAREDLMPVLPSAGKRLLELADVVGSAHAPAVSRVMSAMGKTATSTAAYVNPEAPLPPPALSKTQLTALRLWKMGGAPVNILDFDPLELARQVTLKTSEIFCSVLPEELLATEWMKQSSSLAVNVRALSTLSTDLSNLVQDSILQVEETKKRAATIKHWVKIAARCLDLRNYDTVFAIVCSLDSTNIKRMRKTWEAISQKSKKRLDELKRVIDFTKNFSTLRQSLQSQVPPCIPFMGMYLTDLTFVDHGNQATRDLAQEHGTIPVINLDKHMRTAKIISDLQHFQIPYRLAEVSELQTWVQDQLIRVRSEGAKNYANHWRRSLILEPKETSKTSPNPGSAKDRFDFLAWTHISKDKPLTTSN